jgi:hypothetical protein
MSEYTHNDDVADLLHRKETEYRWMEQDLALARSERDELRLKVAELQTELDRITNEYARGL